MNTPQFLPQSYADLDGTTSSELRDLVRLDTLDTSIVSGTTALEREQLRIRSLVIAKARAILGDTACERVGLLQLQPNTEGRVRIKNAAGFRVIDYGAIDSSSFAEVELASVFVVKVAGTRDQLVPVVIPHGTSPKGQSLKNAIDAATQEYYGRPLEDLLKPRTAKFFESLARAAQGLGASARGWLPTLGVVAVAAAVIGGASMGISAMVKGSHQRYLDGFLSTGNEVRIIRDMPNPHLRMELFDRDFSATDYERLFDSGAPLAQRKVVATSMGEVISLERASSRTAIPGLTYDRVSPHVRISGFNSYDDVVFPSPEYKLQWLRSELIQRISGESDPEVRALLVTAFDKHFPDAPTQLTNPQEDKAAEPGR